MSLDERLPCSMRKPTYVWTVHVPAISNLTLVTKILDPAYMSDETSKFTDPFFFLDISVLQEVAAYLCLQDTNVPCFHGHFPDAHTFARRQDRIRPLDGPHRRQGFPHPRPCTKGQRRLPYTQTRHDPQLESRRIGLSAEEHHLWTPHLVLREGLLTDALRGGFGQRSRGVG